MGEVPLHSDWPARRQAVASYNTTSSHESPTPSHLEPEPAGVLAGTMPGTCRRRRIASASGDSSCAYLTDSVTDINN